MANYYAQARTNYFAVKDEEAFREDIKNYPVSLIHQEQDGRLLFGFLSDSDGGLSNSIYNEETEENEEIVWEDLFEKHLADGWVAVILEIGNEKMRYLNGYAEAYNNKRESKQISLADIYNLALELGQEVTEATY